MLDLRQFFLKVQGENDKSEITGNIFPKLLKYICQNFGKVDDMPLSNVMCLVTEMGMFLKAFTTKECKKALVP